jgi:hypothetical protein
MLLAFRKNLPGRLWSARLPVRAQRTDPSLAHSTFMKENPHEKDPRYFGLGRDSGALNERV